MASFPLKRENGLTFDEINNIFTTMKKSHRVSYTTNNITNQNLDNFYGLIIVENKTTVRLQQLSDYFQEQHRINARRYDDQTPLEYWNSNKTASRDEVRKNVKECTTFCGTIICAVIKLFKSKKILDFCAGWGDRLIGTMTYDDKIKSYYGIDPNKKLHTGYKNMIKSFLPKSSYNKYSMINGCAEDVINSLNETFDLIITSPPYYDLEIYSDDKNQSINRYSSFEEWYNKFLLSSLYQSIEKLDENGVLAININNTRTNNIMDKLIKDIKKVKFLGIIYFGNPKCKTCIYQPILLWQKIN